MIENGFFYDFDREEAFSENDLALIEKKMKGQRVYNSRQNKWHSENNEDN